ncbi:MAG: PaaI family thioesterase [Bacteroidetes bacterium]|nr:PaaI family thioesterase [Bacteroidota bacterium]
MNDIVQMNPRLDFFRAHIGENLSKSISPFGRWLCGTLRSVEYGHMSVEFQIRSDMTNPGGVLHGGVAAAIMDDVSGMMVYALGREFAYTSVNLTCDFLNPAREGDVLLANARVVRAGKNIVHCECEIVTADGKIIAKSSTNLIQTGVRLTE